MRPKIRIYRYLNIFLNNIKKTKLSAPEISVVLDNKETILRYWLENPDQRLNQMLTNLFNFWEFNKNYYTEDEDYLNTIFDIPYNKLLLWGTYGKDGNEPLKHLFIDQLGSDHIIAILDTQKNINSRVKKALLDELLNRNVNYNSTKTTDKYLLDVDSINKFIILNSDLKDKLMEIINVFKNENVDLYIDDLFNINNYLYFTLDVNNYNSLYNLFVYFGKEQVIYNEINKNIFRIVIKK